MDDILSSVRKTEQSLKKLKRKSNKEEKNDSSSDEEKIRKQFELDIHFLLKYIVQSNAHPSNPLE